MEKVLSSYAIIPDALYVERNADRQLARAISDMRKPPYVLVARQMGKTNLLLNAKKALQTADDVFCYLDLTRAFPTLSDFFEYVIDRILDTSDPLREAAHAEVSNLRSKREPELAAITYEKCLLCLLQHIKGRLVVIFDEVDSLANCPFSDSIFSQIRRAYFERGNENLRALTRLTYVLSGVAEPRELIKDRSISPFNIGDRIVLDDFSNSEVATFLSRANLVVPREVVEHLYKETMGNPRMVWDISSQLEDMVLRGATPTPNDVDEIVERLYFNDIPAPPIDHIRSLVTDDRDLRSAVSAIHLGEFSRISDVIRSRLYLAGIARSVSGGVEVAWRNSIVKRSLAPDWLATLPDASIEALQRFDRAFAQENFKEVERVFTTEIDVNSIPAGTRHSYLLRRAHALVGLDRLDEAIALTQSVEIDTTCPYSTRIGAVFLRACCYADQGKNDSALADFARVASSEGDLDQRAYAKHRMTVCLLRLDRTNSPNEAMTALKDTIDFVEDKRQALSPRAVTDILGNSLLALGQLLHAVHSDDEAIATLRRCVSEGSDGAKLRAAKEILDLPAEEKERRSILQQACRSLIASEPNATLPANIVGVDRAVIVKLGAWAYTFEMHAEYDALLMYAQRSGIVANDSVNALKLQMWEAQHETAPTDTRVLREIVDSNAPIYDEVVGRALSHLVSERPTLTKYIERFLARAEWAAKESKLVEDDFGGMQAILRDGADGRHTDAARRVVQLLQMATVNKACHDWFSFWLSLYWAVFFLLRRERRFLAETLAEFFINNAPAQVLEKGFGKVTSETVLKQLKGIVDSPRRAQAQINTQKKYGRNTPVRVKYADGRVVSTKYKRVEDDIRLSKCTIID